MRIKKPKSHQYQFMLVIKSETLDIAERVLTAKVNDALLVYRKGNVVLEFDRKAETFAKAVQSAILDIETIGLQVTAILGSDGGL